MKFSTLLCTLICTLASTMVVAGTPGAGVQDPTVLPEPSSLSMMVAGISALAIYKAYQFFKK